jgi:hypothetical protein
MDMKHPATNWPAVEAAARVLGLDPTTLAFPSVRDVDVPSTLLAKAEALSDEEWAIIGPLCPAEDRANSWSWRELIDTELWALSPKNTISSLSTANAHRCRRRRVAVRGDFDQLAIALRRVAGLCEGRRTALVRIFEACAAEGQRARAKAALAEAGVTIRNEVRCPR